ncbi:MAG: hypothetical protein ACTSU5_10145 [Promethearchaeota archaeon]
MGRLSRIFSKKDLETLEQTRKQFEALVKKTGSRFISLVGIAGKVKGMDVISALNPDSAYERNDVRRFHAKLAEAYLRFSSLELVPNDGTHDLRFVMYSYTGGLEFFVVPIPGSEKFVLVTLTSRQGIAKVLKVVDQIGETLSKVVTENPET